MAANTKPAAAPGNVSPATVTPTPGRKAVPPFDAKRCGAECAKLNQSLDSRLSELGEALRAMAGKYNPSVILRDAFKTGAIEAGYSEKGVNTFWSRMYARGREHHAFPEWPKAPNKDAERVASKRTEKAKEKEEAIKRYSDPAAAQAAIAESTKRLADPGLDMSARASAMEVIQRATEASAAHLKAAQKAAEEENLKTLTKLRDEVIAAAREYHRVGDVEVLRAMLGAVTETRLSRDYASSWIGSKRKEEEEEDATT